MKLTFGICAFLFLSLELSATETVKQKLESTEQTLQVTTIHGSNVSHFSMQNAEGKYSISMSANAGATRKKNLTQADFNYIIKNYMDLPQAPKVPADCYRARMDIVLLKNGTQMSKKSSCFGLNTLTEPKYVHFSQVLVNAL